MAECRRFVCSGCEFSISAWSDGNPYYLDDDGNKVYAYHPDHEALSRCIGNDLPHICLTCGLVFVEDSTAPLGHCPQCCSTEICATYELQGRPCPICHRMPLELDSDFGLIS